MSESIPNYSERILTFLGQSAPLRFPAKAAVETLDYTFDLSQWLQSGETISGTPTITITPSELTITNTIVNSVNFILWLSGGTAYTDHIIEAVVTTSNNPARVKRFIANLVVTDE